MRKVTDWLLFFFMAVSLPAFSDDNVIDEVVWIIGVGRKSVSGCREVG